MGVGSAGSGAADTAQAGIDAVVELQRSIAVPTRLRDTGLDRSLLPAIADDTLRDRGLYFNPRRTESAGPILELLEQAW
jgi:alcohol dehydrogenase